MIELTNLIEFSANTKKASSSVSGAEQSKAKKSELKVRASEKVVASQSVISTIRCRQSWAIVKVRVKVKVNVKAKAKKRRQLIG